MADLAVSITNSINCFGPAPSTKWGSGHMTWGSSKWGEGSVDHITEVEKVLAESIALSGGVASLNPDKAIANSLDFTSETTSLDLRTANGYFYLFVRPTTDADLRNQASYTQASLGSTTYSSTIATSTTWSSA